MGNVKAVVFDLYGTLLYIADQRKPYERLIAQLGVDRELARTAAIKQNHATLQDIVHALAPGHPIDVSSYQHDLEEDVRNVRLYPETLEVLGQLKDKGLKLGMISNLATAYGAPFSALGLSSFFDHAIFSYEAGLEKPQPEIYHRMVANLGVTPLRALMVGDKYRNDVEGPGKIGMPGVLLDRKGKTSHALSIRDLREVLNRI